MRYPSTSLAPAAAPEVRGAPDQGPGAPDPELLGEVVARVVTAAAPDRIILFGSGGRGSMAPHSDLDLLVVKSGEWERHAVDVAIRESLRGLGVPVDLVLATPAELERYGRSIGLVYLPALEEGRAIYESPGVQGARGP